MALSAAVNGQSFLKRIRQSLSKRKNRTYILPTKFGLAFFAMSLVLFFLAVGYANNLIFIFFFSLISVAVMSAIVTNRNIQAIDFLGIKSEEAFAKERGKVSVHVRNRSKSPLYDLEIFFKGLNIVSLEKLLKEEAEVFVSVEIAPQKRGWNKLSPLRVQSPYPFSLFSAWTVYHPEKPILVFPERRGNADFPISASESPEATNAGLFLDHRTFQSTDSVRRIDWRASARRQELFVKNYEESEKPQLAFRWAQTKALENFEERVSQLALWVDKAHRTGHAFSLDLGNKRLGPRQGKDHWRECLEALALLEAKDL